MRLDEILRRDRGRTLQTRMDAETLAEGVLASYEDNEVGDGSYTYDDDSGAVHRFMVAGGGPSAWVVFVRIGDELSAHLEFADSQGRVVIALPDHQAEEMLRTFRDDADERNRR